MALAVQHSPSPPPHRSPSYGNSHYVQPHAEERYGSASAPASGDNIEVTRLCEFLKSCLYNSDNKETAEICASRLYDKNELRQFWRLKLTSSEIMRLPPEIRLLTRALTVEVIYDHEEDLTTQLPSLLDKLHETGCEIDTLNLSACQLKSLPPQIGKLTALTQLDLLANQLKDLPQELTQLTALENLDLRGNALKTVPKVIHQLSTLKSLSLRRNDISLLPLSLKPILTTRPDHAKWVNA